MEELKEFRRISIESDKELVDSLIVLVKENEIKVNKEVELEVKNLTKDLVDNPKSAEIIYAKIIEWKSNFLKVEANDFLFFNEHKERLSYNVSNDDEYYKLCVFGLDIFLNYLKTENYSIQAFTKDFCNQIYSYSKAYSLYLNCDHLIKTINNDAKGSLKLPQLENFEVELYKLLQGEVEYSKSTVRKSFKDISKVEREKDDLESEIDMLKIDLKFLEGKVKSNENYITQLTNKIKEDKDYAPVTQFNKLLWGDNYPALKVFFDFLQKNGIIQFSWSHFAYLMSEGNVEIINLTTSVYSKKELGYLLKKIQPFFTSDYKNTQKRYIEILKRKFSIDFDFLDDNYCKNYIRDYKNTKDWVKTKEEVDNLCLNIAARIF